MSWRDDVGRDDGVRAQYEGDPWRHAAAPGGPRSRPRRRLVTPTRVTLAIALIGSVVYLGYAITVRDTRQIPLLASGAAVLGLVFGALALAGGVSTYRAGRDGRMGAALGFAIAGGVAGLAAAGAIAFALVLTLAYRP